jgi:signal transduction histidine kinase
MGRFMEGFGVGERMNVHFTVTTPNVSWNKRWEDLEAICTAQPEFEITSRARRSRQGNGISFSGPLSFSDDGKFAIFLCCPNVRNLDEMYDYKISMTDMAAYGCRLQMVLQEDHLIHAQETASRMQRLTEAVNAEKEKSVQLMQDVADKAEEALATKKTFVRYVSHEIRTPLTVAKLGLMLVNKEVEAKLGATEPESEIGAHIKDCEQSLDVAVSILDDLLSYEKLESGIYELFRDVVPAVSFVEQAIRMFSIQVRKHNIVLQKYDQC